MACWSPGFSCEARLGIVPSTISMPLFLKANIPKAPEDREGSVPIPQFFPNPPLSSLLSFLQSKSISQTSSRALPDTGQQLWVVKFLPFLTARCSRSGSNLLSSLLVRGHLGLSKDPKICCLGGWGQPEQDLCLLKKKTWFRNNGLYYTFQVIGKMRPSLCLILVNVNINGDCWQEPP
jgi:hypothetical protein